MIRLSELKLPLSALDWDRESLREIHPLPALRALVCARLGVQEGDIAELHVHKRSFDARKRGAKDEPVQAVYICDVQLNDAAAQSRILAQHAADPHVQPHPGPIWSATPCGTTPALRPVVVGFGPCGMFAALMLARMGLEPIVIERGPTVRERTQQTWGLWRQSQLNPEANVQFGEGGAGTFSDGKLYSQIKDPRQIGRAVLQAMVEHGAPEDILYAAHPHIGTFKLVKVVEGIRNEIIRLGGKIYFDHKLTALHTVSVAAHSPKLPQNPSMTPPGSGHASAPDALRQVQGLRVLNQKTGQVHDIYTAHVVLALGHSARDTFVMLHAAGLAMQAKPFSVGFRIEHPQSVIDRARWGAAAGHPLLGAADYKLVHHASNGRAVYSFCMCPGGTVVAATSEADRVVTNGMSQYSRAERNANAGLVCSVDVGDFPSAAQDLAAAFPEAQALGVNFALEQQHYQHQQVTHPLAGIALQRSLESRAFALGGGDYWAPAQRVGDYMAAQCSAALGSVEPSYRPGVRAAALHTALPDWARAAIVQALPVFGRKIRGYDMADAVLTGLETRTSSPLRILRGADFQSLNFHGLYPAGEGAGWAGGILSAAVDGIKVAEAIACALTGRAQPDSGVRGSGGAA